MTATVGNIAFDCEDVLATAHFWSTVLGRPLDVDGNTEFATIGGGDSKQAEPAWYFNTVPEAKRAKNRLHLDLIDPDPSAVERLVALGGAVVANHRLGDHQWTVMHDPEGNEFCIAPHPHTGTKP